MAAEDEIVEHATRTKGGDMHVMYEDEDYPIERRIEHVQRFAGRVYRRRILVLEDWTEVPRG